MVKRAFREWSTRCFCPPALPPVRLHDTPSANRSAQSHRTSVAESTPNRAPGVPALRFFRRADDVLRVAKLVFAWVGCPFLQQPAPWHGAIDEPSTPWTD